jgi:anti-sigma factor RsiW
MESMMSHATEGQLQAYLDGEAGGGDRASVQEHLRRCGECAAALAELRAVSESAAQAFALLDAPAPSVRHALARFEAARGARPRRRFETGRRALVRAAMLVLAVAGVASAAIPGSPVRRWLAMATERVAGVLTPAERPAAEAPLPAPAMEAMAGASAVPAQGRVRVVLAEVAEGTTVRVLLVDGGRAIVRADETSGARFTSGPGRVEARGVELGQIIVELPRNALVATVELDGQVVVSREGDALIARQVRLLEAEPGMVLFRVAP